WWCAHLTKHNIQPWDACPEAGSTRSRSRFRRLGALVLLAAGAAGLAMLYLKGGMFSAPWTTRDQRSLMREVPFTDRPAFQEQPQVAAQEREQRQVASSLVEDPVTGTAVADFAGSTTNVQGGVRASRRSRCVQCPVVTVWMLGGSAAFGLGQRDEQTIASQLVKLAERDGLNLEITNLSAPGWTSWQEAAAFSRHLGQFGAPDVVLVYDGFNDVLGTLIGTATGARDDELGRPVIATEEVAALTRNWRPLSAAGEPSAVGSRIAERHLTSKAAIQAAAARVGAQVVFVVQPDALAGPVQRDEAAKVAERPVVSDFGYIDAVLEVAARSSERAGALNLRHSLDDEQRAVFADLVHNNERGAALVATKIYARLRPTVVGQSGRP
ncbi:MAG: hypothetical protein ACKO04_01275, partial [Actinomycetes bacterium]